MWSRGEGVGDVWRKARIDGLRSLGAIVEGRREGGKEGRVESFVERE